MSKVALGGLAFLGVLVATALVVVLYVVGINNQEVSLRKTIEAKQKDNTSEYDNMWKKISQVAQVTDAQKEALREIFVEHAQARTGEGGKAIMNWIQESVPNVDTSTFNNLMNVITGSRDRWTMQQKQLIDLSREHNILLEKWPSGFILQFLGRKPVKIKVVTSTRTEDAFTTGADDDVDVFRRPAQVTTGTK